MHELVHVLDDESIVTWVEHDVWERKLNTVGERACLEVERDVPCVLELDELKLLVVCDAQSPLRCCEARRGDEKLRDLEGELVHREG
jgi:hypothetical protein